MTERVERASELHLRGYNCAQAVACAFADAAGADEREVFRMTEAFGFGLGCMQGTCGALVGACAIAGLMSSDANLENPGSKRLTYKASARMVERFRERVGDIVCGVIKGRTGGPVLMPCHDCVIIAAEIVEEELFSN